ncbi:putative U11/U12 small nuclear ribonucleoprotein 25kDa protein [Helianthus annuus]|nr:putative U11/U12 small nuclear ribonucleoprotein 25kDa protein [Helianthus annuus]
MCTNIYLMQCGSYLCFWFQLNSLFYIGWARSHVWGHFCLCYEGEKLLDDKAYIKRLGIKDGDQIKFVRHITINYRAGRQQIKNQSDEPKHCSMYRTSDMP